MVRWTGRGSVLGLLLRAGESPSSSCAQGVRLLGQRALDLSGAPLALENTEVSGTGTCYGLDCLGPELRAQAHECVNVAEVRTEYWIINILYDEYLRRTASTSLNKSSLAEARRVGCLHTVSMNFGLCLPLACHDGVHKTGASAAVRAVLLWRSLVTSCPRTLETAPLLMESEVGPLNKFRDMWAGGLLTGTSVLSFPGCGSTWLQVIMMVALSISNTSYMLDDELPASSLFDAHATLSVFEKSHGEDFHDHPFSVSGPELQSKFFHELSLSKMDPLSPGGKVILLLRDPLDVLVSVYYHRKYRESFRHGQEDWRLPSDMSLQDFALDFEAKGSLGTYLAFLNGWVPLALQRPEHVMIVTYEALNSCPMRMLARILNGFLGLRVPCRALAHAVRATNIGKLQKASQHTAHYGLMSNSEGTVAEQKFRRGISFAAHEELSVDALKAAQRALKALNPLVLRAFDGTKACHLWPDLMSSRSPMPVWPVEPEDVIC